VEENDDDRSVEKMLCGSGLWKVVLEVVVGVGEAVVSSQVKS